MRTQLASWRPLIDEAARAELRVGGLLIDFGGADQHKYTLGSWRTGWGDRKVDPDGINLVQVNGRSGKLDVVTLQPVKEIVLRARSGVAGQRVTVQRGDVALGNADVGAAWTELRIPVKDGALPPGRHDLHVIFGKPGSGARAEIDWMWLRTEDRSETIVPIPRLIPLAMSGTPKRSLPAPSARTYSFYLHVPETGSLVFDYASEQPVEFIVRATTDGAETAELHRVKATSKWQEARVDLSSLAGKAVRLDLATEGPAAPAGWGQPEIMIDRGAARPRTDAPAVPRNIVVILIDTVRADMFAPFAPSNNAKTPRFDELARSSLVFQHAYNNENWTKPSVATLLSGLYPVTHDTKKDSSALPAEVALLPEQLKSNGFATAAFIANGYISDKFGFRRGWDSFKNYIRENKPSEAEYVYGDAIAWVKEHKDERFFLYLQTIDPHVVYQVDRPYTSLYYPSDYNGPVGQRLTGQMQVDISKGKVKATENDYKWIEALYKGEVSYHDEHMGKFFDELAALGLMEDTLIVITNDHGEELNEHGRLGHGHSLYEELLRNPLVFHYPKAIAPGVITEVVESVDVTPTLLDLLGLPPIPDIDGESLIPLIRGLPVRRPYYAISEFLDLKRSIRVGQYKMMRSAGDWLELYDLDADPREQNNLANERPIARRLCDIYFAEAAAMPRKVQRQQDAGARRKLEASKADVDPELRKQLEALGYFGD